MKADQIIKNAKIYTADKDHTIASALVVKDGKFAYVGNETGLADFEGEVMDLGGKFVMPGIIDSHVHVTTGVGFEYADLGLRFECNGKQDALDFMVNYIKELNEAGLDLHVHTVGERASRIILDGVELARIEEMLLGYTINGAIQMGVEDSKGSIETGKDADFLVFDNDLLTAEHEGFSYNRPREVYFRGKRVN